MKRFVNRSEELSFLNEQYTSTSAALVVLYGRRRLGKTSLIQEFAKDKPFLYFLATEEDGQSNMRMLKNRIAEYVGDELLAQASIDNWDILFQTLARHISDQRLVLALDEFQYLGKSNPSFPSVFQRIWEMHLQDKNIMVILCGSLIHMMESQALNYSSPLYGRRTGQIKLRQIEFQHYSSFFEELGYQELIEYYAVTGGVPKYIEVFDGKADIFSEIEKHVLNKQSLLFEEPVFLLQNEVKEIGSYFSIIRSIAAGNCRLGAICAEIGIKQTNLPKYLKTLIDLDIIEREVPVTESNPEKSKMGQYRIKDNFQSFWFRFVYPEKARLELSDIAPVMQKIRTNFVDNHVAHVYESVCMSEMWQLAHQGKISFNKLGRWWNNKEEIDIVAIDSSTDTIIFAECKYTNKPMDIDVFKTLLRKKEQLPWKKDSRTERFVLFSISGFSEHLKEYAADRDDLILIRNRKDT